MTQRYLSFTVNNSKIKTMTVFDCTKFDEDWVVGARLKEQPTDVTKYCLNCISINNEKEI